MHLRNLLFVGWSALLGSPLLQAQITLDTPMVSLESGRTHTFKAFRGLIGCSCTWEVRKGGGTIEAHTGRFKAPEIHGKTCIVHIRATEVPLFGGKPSVVEGLVTVRPRLEERKELAAPPRPFDPERDVVPFDARKVGHWPGLPNLGGSCFFNTSLKLLACASDLDPYLVDLPEDDAHTARLRRHLRLTLNFIRSAGSCSSRTERSAEHHLKAFHHSLVQHEATRRVDDEILHGGGNVGDFIHCVLRSLGVEDLFDVQVTEQLVPSESGAPVRYQEGVPLELRVTLHRPTAGRDLTGIRTLNDCLATFLPGPGTAAGEPPCRHFLLPTQVPRTVLLPIERITPDKVLAFSGTVAFPLFEVDQVRHTSTPGVTVARQAVGIAMGTPGHVHAIIRGEDGWYVQDDEKPPRRAEAAELDDALSPEGELERGAVCLLYQP